MMKGNGKLKVLLEAASDENRRQWANKWKEKGGKVVGVLDTYMPCEVIHAAGLMPWWVSGTPREPALALAYRPPWTNPRNTHIFESVLSGELDFLDGVVSSDWDFDNLRLWDAWTSLKKTPFTHAMYVPRYPVLKDGIAYKKMEVSINRLINAVEKFTGERIREEALRQSIKVYNEMRSLLAKVYELRKREKPSVSGFETLGITLAAMVMPPEEFNKDLKEVLPLLEQRQASLKVLRPRLLVSGYGLDRREYMDVVEDCGCVVAMDDLDTGSRFVFGEVEEVSRDGVGALARGYLDRPGCPRMPDWERQMDNLLGWVKEYKIDGVLELTLRNCLAPALRHPYMRDRLSRAGVPFLMLLREYPMSQEGQLRTRIGAFIEMIQSR